MKKIKIKWINVIKLLLFIFCVLTILHDMYMLTINSWITGKQYGFTWLGLLTFILFCVLVSFIYDDFKEQTKSIPSYRPKHAKDTIRK